MYDLLSLGAAAVGGAILGAVFFGGLWWTVHRGVSSGRPAPWFIISPLVRTSIVLGGMYLVTGGQWELVLSCLLGFSVARPAVMRLTRRAAVGQPDPSREAGHAP